MFRRMTTAVPAWLLTAARRRVVDQLRTEAVHHRRRPLMVVDERTRQYIEASPFVLVASSGPGGIDCSPRGDPAGFVRVVDERTLMLPDRRGNNRLDTLRNLVVDPRIGLLFLVPGRLDEFGRHRRGRDDARGRPAGDASPGCGRRCRPARATSMRSPARWSASWRSPMGRSSRPA